MCPTKKPTTAQLTSTTKISHNSVQARENSNVLEAERVGVAKKI